MCDILFFSRIPVFDMHDNGECGHTWRSTKYGELQSMVLYSIILNSYAHSFFHSYDVNGTSQLCFSIFCRYYGFLNLMSLVL